MLKLTRSLTSEVSELILKVRFYVLMLAKLTSFHPKDVSPSSWGVWRHAILAPPMRYILKHGTPWNEPKPPETTGNQPHFVKPPEATHYLLKFSWNQPKIFPESYYGHTCTRYPLLGITQKWSYWTGDHLIKHLCKTTKNQIWLFLGFLVFIFTVNVL